VASFSQDDRFVVLADRSGELTVWRSQDFSVTGKPLRLGGEVNRLVFVPGGNALVAMTHNWIHLLALSSAGVSVRASRLADFPGGSNSLYFPDRSGEQMILATAKRGGEPESRHLYIDAREDQPLEGNAADMLFDWSGRLGLVIGQDGSVLPRGEIGSKNVQRPAQTVD
jgi:hypothetical protein